MLDELDKELERRGHIFFRYARYGYRRIHSVISSVGTIVSEKVIRRIMKEENLVVPNIKRKKYNSYKG